ncbi:SdrD B-like domain-containing protein [Cellulomonas denverensis]|uniref:SdrD B-like domain-containing protein n=1 Tax=Cellulomonas denverensis TaxID=264297 RepID=UPI0035E8EA88
MDVRTTMVPGLGRRAIRGWAVLLVAVLALAASVVVAPGAWAGGEGRAALSVSKTVSATSAQPGDRVTWSIDLTCESITAMCADVVLTDAVPEPFVIDGEPSVQGQRTGTARTDVAGNRVQVTFRETDASGPGLTGLAAGQSVSVLVQTVLPADLGLSWDGSTVVNTADVTATNADPVADDASLVLAVPVTPQVALTKTWTPTDQVAGDDTDQHLVLGVANTSPVPATALTVTDPAPGADPAFGPGTPIELRGFGDWTAPEGATGLSLDLTGPAGTVTAGPFAPGTPIDTTGIDLSTITAFTLRFHGDTTTEGTLAADGSAGAVTVITGQNGTAPRDATTTVPNTATAQVTTGHGTATDDATARLQLNPVTVEVTAGKTFDGAPRAEVVAGETAVLRLSAQNSANTALSGMTVQDPTGGTAPFGSLADGLLEVTGFGADGSGSSLAADWPRGATSAQVTLTGTGAGLPLTVTVPAPTGSTVTWPQLPAGAVVTGIAVAYTGVIEPGATAGIPVQVRTGEDWDTTRGFANQLTVSGTATDGTPAEDRTADATLTVQPRRIVTTTSKELTQRVDGQQISGVAGQEIAARITGRISADSTVPADRLVIEDVAGPDATVWDHAALDRIGSVQVPAGSQAEVLVRVGGSWVSLAGPSGDATGFLDLAVPAGADGMRVVYTPETAGGSLPIDGSFTPAVVLVMTLTETVPPGTSLTNTASSTGQNQDAGLAGSSQGQDTTTTGPGGTAVDLRRVDAAKSWRDAAALIPVDNDDPAATDRPANRLTLQVQNVSGIPVGTLRLTDPDPAAPANAFDLVDLTRLTVQAPAGAREVLVTLRDRDGAVLHTGSAEQIAALTAEDLREVASIQAVATGTLPDGAILRVRADTVLRAASRADGSPILGTADAEPVTTATNTLIGDLGPDTPSDTARADTVFYPEARQPLAGALSKSVTPDTGTRYAATDRTVRLTMSARRTSDAAVSRPSQYVLEDTTPEFWDRFDLVALQSLSGVVEADGPGWTAAVQYLVDGSWSAAVSSELCPGTATAMPSLPTGAGDLPAGVTAGAVTGVRITFTAPPGQWFANRAVGGFEGPTAVFALSPRSTLRSTGEEVPAGTVSNVLTGTVTAERLTTPVVLDPVTAPYTVTDGVPDAQVTKSPVTTTTGPGAAIPFTLTAVNTGSAPLVDPVLTDVLPADAAGPLLDYDPEVHGAAVVTGVSATPEVTATADAVTVTFPPGTRLLPGERIQVTLPLAVRVGTPAGTTLTNRFVLDTAEGLTREATATVNVVAMATYLRVKDVAEDVAPGAAPTGVVNTTGGECSSADGFYRNPCLVRTAPGGSETWRMRVTNTGNLPTSSLTLVDVLPAPGDTGTSRSQSSSARGSVWATEYLGDLVVTGVPAGGTSTVSYLLDGQTCRYTGEARSADPYGDGCAASVWTPADQVTDLSQVRGIRVDVDVTAAPLQPGDLVTVTFRTRSATAYDLAAAHTDAPAWNTMVVSTTSLGATGPVYETLEPNRAGVAVDRRFAIGDRVWIDRDRNGRQDDGEPGVGGVTVRVVPEDAVAGTAVALDAVAGTAVTDADGHWVVDDLPAGRYRVQFEPGADLAGAYRFTSAESAEPELDSNPDPATGWTGTVVLDADQPRVRAAVAADGVSAAFIDPTVDAGLVSLPLRPGDPADPGDPGVTTGTPTGPVQAVILAITGADPRWLVLAGLGALALGALTMIGVRRRRA